MKVDEASEGDSLSGWLESATESQRRAAAVLAALIDARGPVSAFALVDSVAEYPGTGPIALAELDADVSLLASFGLDIDRTNLDEVSYSIAEASWQQRPVLLDEIDRAILDRALALAGTRDAALAEAVSMLHGHRGLRQADVTVSLSPRGSGARGRPEAYSRLHRLAGLMARRVTAAFGYPDERGRIVPRTLRTAGLGESRGAWFAVGTDDTSDVVRAFAVSEMRGPVQEAGPEGSYTIPDGFDPAAYLALAWRLGPDPVTARVRFDRTLSAFVSTMLEEFHPRAVDDDSVEVEFPVGNLDSFVGWTLSFGTHARILEPAEAIARAREMLIGVVEKHG